MTPKTISVGQVVFGNHLPFTLIAGPCLLESLDHAMKMATSLKEITDRLKIPFVFKTSFDKANRTSIQGARGIGMKEAILIFQNIRNTFGCPIVTDVHLPEQCDEVAKSVDLLQIPAFLCRQTDLLKAAAQTGLPVMIKKGQFLAPWDMVNVVKKMEAFGCSKFMLCERGASFGYNTLVNDMRSLPIMAKTGYPVVFDATHSVQQPGGEGASTGGDRRFVPVLARAAVAVGIAGLFMEVHDNPENAPSDGPNMVRLGELEQILKVLIDLDRISKSSPLSL